ncbi:MAG: anhydro-N-acetylmuramic acid kinase [Colwellia sp.]|jgi:anhydro-N-acetylmuramic acid kinase
MEHTPKYILGLMSGTSLDGLDLALCEFVPAKIVAGEKATSKASKPYSFKIIQATTLSYKHKMEQMLFGSISDPADILLANHQKYGQWIGKKVKEFLNKNNLSCDLIASHGHTVHHRPDLGFTFQMGAGQAIANHSGIPVVSDFRSIDISLGGQGAPLVPIGDLLLFPEYKYCLNIGGISNISIKTPSLMKAYDVGLANILLNYLAGLKGYSYDHGGAMASSGQLYQPLFDVLNQLKYHQRAAPKSLGIEFFNSQVKPLFEKANLTVEDALHTAVHYISFQIQQSLKKQLLTKEKVLITGGGAKNIFLMKCLEEYCGKNSTLIVPEPEIIDFKEALIFAFMGFLFSKGENNCLKSVTGAKSDSIGGYLYHPL